MNHIYFSSVGLSSQMRLLGSGCTDFLSYAPGVGVVSVLILEGSLSSCHWAPNFLCFQSDNECLLNNKGVLKPNKLAETQEADLTLWLK